MRMSYDAPGAIKVMQEGLMPGRPHSFAQADMIVSVFWFLNLFLHHWPSLCSLSSSSPGRC